MAVSDQLLNLADEVTKLAERAKVAETRAAEAVEKTKAELEQERDATFAAAKAQDARLRAAADESRGQLSAGWAGLQKSWDEHVADFRKRVEGKKADIDLHVARAHADDAEANAAFAVDFAYAAVVDAEYAVLDAALARMDADELES